MTDLYNQIKHLHPCFAAVEWLGDRTLEEAWGECERGDWMLWLAGCAGVERKLLVLSACDCTEPALKFAKGDEAETAIRTTRLWCNGKATLHEVRAAADAAYDAANAAFYAARAAAYAAYAAADAADAAGAAARAAAHAAYAAAYAADTAWRGWYSAALGAAEAASLKHSAELVRARIPAEVVREALKGEVK